MKTEIRKIMEMKDSGKISTEQAIELIEALGSSETSRPTDEAKTTKSKSEKSSDEFDLGTSIGQFVAEQLSQFGISTKKVSEPSASSDNSINLSKFNNPTGTAYEFSDNSITMSKFENVHLDDSSFCSWSVNASNVNGIVLTRSKASDVGVHGSSLSSFTLTESEFSDISLNGSKVNTLTLDDRSKMEDIRLHGVSWKNVKLDSSILIDCTMNGSKCSDTLFKDCHVEDFKVHASQLNNCEFLNCKLIDGVFKNCNLNNVIFKNIEWNDFNASNLKLSHRTINSLEELKAMSN